MQVSRFVVVYRDVAIGEHVLYSVLADRYVGVDDATLNAIERWSSGEPPDTNEAATAELLLESGFLTASREMDDERLRRHLEKASEGMPGTMYITVMPTLVCNLACTYCFQKESPAFNVMNNEVESGTVRWILGRVDESGCRRLVVHYFGGEPLTRKDSVLRTARAFSEAMAARGGEFNWEMTTNGVHLDLPFVEALKKYGEGAIKITLDGDRETHDGARVYRDGRGSFDIVFANLQAVAGHVRLRVGGNFRAGQEASYEKLLSRLEEADLLGMLDGVRFKPIEDTERKGSTSCTGCTGSAKTTETLIQINQSVERRAATRPALRMPETAPAPCELHWRNSYIIDPDGGVFKCPAVAGRPEMAVTNVFSDGDEKPAPLLQYRPWEKQCGDCAFLPVCVGGCLGAEYLATGRLDQVHCRKPELEARTRERVTRNYRVEMDGRGWESVEAAIA